MDQQNLWIFYNIIQKYIYILYSRYYIYFYIIVYSSNMLANWIIKCNKIFKLFIFEVSSNILKTYQFLVRNKHSLEKSLENKKKRKSILTKFIFITLQGYVTQWYNNSNDLGNFSSWNRPQSRLSEIYFEISHK